MANEKLDKLGALLSDIGGEGAHIVGGDPNGLYIYGEVEDGATFGAVFKDEGHQVRYYDPSRPLLALMRRAWELDRPNKRWLVMEYAVKGTTFDVDFTYPEEVNPKEEAWDRRPVALKKRYGNKPIVYPPIPASFRRYRPEPES